MNKEIVIPEESNFTKNDYLPKNVTTNVNLEEVRVQTLSINEAEGETKVFNLTLGHILRDNYVNNIKA